jgi:hypothetical protein
MAGEKNMLDVILLIGIVLVLGMWIWRLYEDRIAELKTGYEARLAEVKSSYDTRVSELKELYEKRVREAFERGQNDIRGKIRTFVFRVEEIDKKLLGLPTIKIQKSLVIVMIGEQVVAAFGDLHRLTTSQLTPEMKKLLRAVVAAATAGLGAAGLPSMS